MGAEDLSDVVGDPAAFEAFYRRHVAAVGRFLARRVIDPQLVADLTAEVFHEAIRSAHTYRPGRGSELGWLYGIARNVLANDRRREALRLRAEQGAAGQRVLDDDDIVRLEERIDAESAARRLRQALCVLPENERAVVELVAVDGLSLKDAAAALGIRPGTARVRMYRARHLNRAAAVARAQNAPLPRPDQVSYSKQLIVSPGPRGGIRECLVQWSPSPLTGLAGGVEGGKCGPGVPVVPTTLKEMRSPSKPSYLYPALNTLPTSPAALRATLYAAAARGGAAWGVPSVHSADVIVSILIGRLEGVPLSGPLRASLYELLARMPGVTLVRNAVDAACLHGTGIVMKWDYPGYGLGTGETIFAPRTYAVLGGGDIRPGQRVYSAILGSGLVTLPGS